MRNISKRFGGEQALNGVDLTVGAGEVHGLLGENGSGKSTLIKILAGYHAPEPGGELRINGTSIDLPLKPGDFRGLRMSFVHQQLGLIPSLTVVENLFLSRLGTAPVRRVNWKRMRAEARRVLARFGVTLDVNTRVERLSQVERALLAIVRAASELGDGTTGEAQDGPAVSGGLLVLDEPTVFLSEEGRERLFRLIADVAADGASVIFVSHDLDEVLAATHRVTVLRDGHVVGDVVSSNASKSELVTMIVGHQLEVLEGHGSARPNLQGEAVVVVERVSSEITPVRDASFELHEGEILGLTGLVGSGFHDVPYALCGVWQGTTGSLTLNGRVHDLARMTPAKALALGIALLPADRQRDGSIGSLSIADNVMMQVLDSYMTRGFLRRRQMARDAAAVLSKFDVRPNDPRMLYQALSGGNQQKVLLAKWLQTNPKVFLLHEPTQGVDIGARAQIFALLREVASTGVSIACASSDYEQLEQLCSRVLIFGDGRVVQELVGSEVTKDRITEQSLTAQAARAMTAAE